MKMFGDFEVQLGVLFDVLEENWLLEAKMFETTTPAMITCHFTETR